VDSVERIGSVAWLRTVLLSALQTDHRSVAAVAVAVGYYRILKNIEIRSDKGITDVLTACCLLRLLLLTEQTCTSGSWGGVAEESSGRLSWLLLLGLLAKYPGSGSGSGGTERPCGGLSEDRFVCG